MDKLITILTVEEAEHVPFRPYTDIATAINNANQNVLDAQHNKQDDYIKNYGGLN